MAWWIDSGTLVKLFLAVALGAAVGLERELRGRPAGLRTHILVCLGATLAMVVGRHVAAGAACELARVVAGVITGVGFLGAGEIIRMELGVRGLTTAACLWLVAALGVAIGAQMYAVSILAAALAVAVLSVFHRVERAIPALLSRKVSVTLDGDPAAASAVGEALIACGCRIVGRSVEYDGRSGTSRLDYAVRVREREDPAQAVRRLASIKQVRQVSWQ